MMVPYATSLNTGSMASGSARNKAGTYASDRLMIHQYVNNELVGSIRSIYVDAKGIVWIATYDAGLVYYNNNGAVLKHITTENGLPSNALQKVLEDDSGHLWINTNLGAFRMSLEDAMACATGKLDYIQGVWYKTGEGNHNGGWLDPDGKVWFGTIQNAIAIDTTNVHINTCVPGVFIDTFTASETAYDMNTDIVIPPQSRRINVKYSATSFEEPQRNRFRYKVEGRDEDWIDAGNQRSVTIENLDPGTYTFRVIASNNHGIWNEKALQSFLQSSHFFMKPHGLWVAVF